MSSGGDRVPVVEGYFVERPDGTAALVGGKCERCGSYFFPKRFSFCRNPECGEPGLIDVDLSTRGTLWSFTDNRYAPPPPYPASEPFEPYGVAAVTLEVGQLAEQFDERRAVLAVDLEHEPVALAPHRTRPVAHASPPSFVMVAQSPCSCRR